MAISRIALGTRKGLLLLVKDDGDWKIRQEAFPGSQVSYVFLDKLTGNLFACLDDGHFGCKMFRWTGFADDRQWSERDPKETWKQIATPEYPAGSKLPDGKDAVTAYLWAMATSGDADSRKLYVGTEPGGLFVSLDQGDSFELVQSLWDHPSRTAEGQPWFGGGRDQAGIHSICVDPRDESRIHVGISVAGVFFSEDGGQTWAPRNRGMRAEFLPNPDAEVGQDPHLLVLCHTNPDILWNQNHCGVYRSLDGGQNWDCVTEENGPVNFGFAIAVDPENGDRAWVIPAESDMVRCAVERKMCVCRTENGGQSWTAFRDGLPQNDCYDFAFRHNLIFRDGDLVFGTAGGSLYFSDDEGENWSNLNEHLPPIYCLAEV